MINKISISYIHKFFSVFSFAPMTFWFQTSAMVWISDSYIHCRDRCGYYQQEWQSVSSYFPLGVNESRAAWALARPGEAGCCWRMCWGGSNEGYRSQEEDTLLTLLISSVSGQSLTAPHLLHHVGRGVRRGGVSVSHHLDTPRDVPRNLILTMITHNISFEFYFNIYFFMFLFVSADPSKSAHKILYHSHQLILKCLMLHAFYANTAYFHNCCFLTTVPPKSK